MPVRYCGLCNCPIYLSPLRTSGLYNFYETRGCARCIHNDLYFQYRNEFLKILRKTEWDVETRVRKQMNYAVKEIGIIEAERALITAMQIYRVDAKIKSARNPPL